jgi:predicted nucleic acid-binding protein
MKFVLDASVALLWLVPNTNPLGVEYAGAVLDELKESQSIVPSLFALEVANVVAKAESKGIVTEADSQRFIFLLGQLNIVTDQATAAHALGDTLNLARRYKLSTYDAAYLEIALRSGLPLATLDANLAKAAITAGVPIFGTH